MEELGWVGVLGPSLPWLTQVRPSEALVVSYQRGPWIRDVPALYQGSQSSLSFAVCYGWESLSALWHGIRILSMAVYFLLCFVLFRQG